MGNIIGSIIGGLVVIYLIGKPIEWLLLKRMTSDHTKLVWQSSGISFALLFLVWFLQRNEASASQVGSNIFFYFISSTLLPIIRIYWKKRKTKTI